jgi:hypothetical protein
LLEGDRAEARRAKADGLISVIFVRTWGHFRPPLMRRLPFPARRIWSKHPSRAGLCLCASPEDAHRRALFLCRFSGSRCLNAPTSNRS